MTSPALSLRFSSPILGYPPASSAFAIFWPSHAGHVSDLLYITAAKCAGVSSKCKPVHAPPKQGESFGYFFFSKKNVPHIRFPFDYPVYHPSSQQRLSIPWDAGTPHHDPLGVVLLVLVMLLVLVLLPRVRAQRHVRHVAQSVVVDAMFGLRRRRAMVA